MERVIFIKMTNLMIIIRISYILNIDLQCFFIMVEVLGELKSLVIKGEDRLKEGQHLKRSQHREELLFRIKKIWVKDKLMRKLCG